eukprot:40753-Pelagomonas_calceolata.AAC.2
MGMRRQQRGGGGCESNWLHTSSSVFAAQTQDCSNLRNKQGSANKGEQGPARPQLPLAHCSLLSSTTTCSPAYSTMMLLHMRCQG